MEPDLRFLPVSDWTTLVLFGSLVLVVVAKRLYYQRFLNFLALPLNNKYFSQFSNKELLSHSFHILVTVFQIINSGLFLYFTWTIFSENTNRAPQIVPFLGFVGGLVLFLVAKVMLQLGNGFVFGSFGFFNEVVFKKLSYLNYGGLVLFLANVLLNYVLIGSKLVVYVGFFLFLAINLIGWITVVKNSEKVVLPYLFYFILYLCALEIAPLVLLGNFLK
ncbi:DUF4271 domain-containing protein [Maribacter sp. 2307ULW6-5]|uniref:DUF4271 domain-containing protein n=1 Tax=Maribacter sp. 2307ULW6-5 TaxID=3386275 RepID=UPI0039BC7BEE